MPRRQQPGRGRLPDPALKEKIPIPVLQSGKVDLLIPPFFATPNKGKSQYKWKLVNPLTKIRNIAQRNGALAIKPTRAVNVKKPAVGFEFAKPRPTMGDFSPSDRKKLEEYARRFEETKEEDGITEATPVENKQRGFPPVLHKNAIKAGFTPSSDPVYYKEAYTTKEPKEPKRRGRPKGPKKSREPEPEPSREPEPEPEPEEEKEEEPSNVEPDTYISLDEYKEKTRNDKAWLLYKALSANKDITVRSTTATYSSGRQAGEIVVFGAGAMKSGGWKSPADMSGEIRGVSGVPSKAYDELYQDFLRQMRGGGGEAPKKKKEKEPSQPKQKEPAPTKAPREKKISKKAELARLDSIADLDTMEGLNYGKWDNEKTNALFEMLLSAIAYKETGNPPRVKRPNSKDSQIYLTKVKYLVDHYSLAKLKKVFEERYGDKEEGEGLSTYNRESDLYSSGDDEGESGGDLSGFVRKLIHGRKEFSPSAKRVLEANGTAVITGMELHRNPLPSLYQKTLSFLSGGETDQILADKNKDKLFHLSLWVKLSNGKTVKIDKTTSVGLSLSPKAPRQEESLEVVLPSRTPEGLKEIPPNLTLNEFLNKALERVGVDRFFSYNAETNNCSDFIEMLLKEIGLWKEPSVSFVEQPAKEILGRFGLLSKVVKGITDLGHTADIIMEGGDIDALDQNIVHTSNFPHGILHGGDIDAQHQHFIHASGLLNQKVDWEEKRKSHDSNIMRGSGFHSEQHPALRSDLYPRIPQAFTQIYMSHPHPLAVHSMDGGKINIHSIEHGAKKFFTHTLPSTLIHKALPMAIGATASALTDNPVVGAVASKTVGQEAGNALGKAVGMGLKKKKFVKGSPEAREHMRKLREMRGKKISGGLIPSPHSRSPITDPSLL